jgi:hypothetical protein
MAREAHLEQTTSAGTERGRGMRGYTETMQVREPNTGQVHIVIPDGPKDATVGATNHTLRTSALCS